MSAVATSSKNFPGSSSHRTRRTNNKKLSLTPPKASVRNPHLFNINHSGSKMVTYRNLHPSEPEYDQINDMMRNEDFVIENIVKVYNPFLETAYNLKKAQKLAFYGNSVCEEFLFHGTKKEHVNSICTFNFDWRLNGQNTGHRFGKGVNFTPDDTYASHYCDSDNDHKVMIVAKVLIARACVGHQKMPIPPPGFDTSKKSNGMVVVKYEDNEFLPMYKLYYHVDDYDDSDDDYDDSDDDYDDSDDDYEGEDNEYSSSDNEEYSASDDEYSGSDDEYSGSEEEYSSYSDDEY